MHSLEVFLEKKAQEQLFDLLQDCFGNYVVQTCLSEGITKANREYLLMVDLLSPYAHHLRNTPYGKKILHHFGFSEVQNSNDSGTRNQYWTPTKYMDRSLNQDHRNQNLVDNYRSQQHVTDRNHNFGAMDPRSISEPRIPGNHMDQRVHQDSRISTISFYK